MRAGAAPGRAACALALLAAAASVLLVARAASPPGTALAAKATVHTIFLNDCTRYSDWQTAAVVFGWRESGQPGQLTRVACCTPEEKAAYLETRRGLLSLVPTHIAPSYARHPRTGDEYAPYNKPAGVIDWLERVRPEEDWVLVLDGDMILRRPFEPGAYMGLTGPGSAAGARYDYLAGVDNALAERHIPEVAPRRDSRAGPPGRRADRVGGFYYLHRDDLRRVAPLWLKYTEDVRADPEAWHLSGDFYSKKPGEKPWISEMYGYVFGAAKLDLWHTWDETSMIYPGYTPTGVPRVLHFGLLWHLEYEGGMWGFDKHWFMDFDIAACPPWDRTTDRPKAGLFPEPPLPSQLKNGLSKVERYRDLISIEVVHTINAAICEYHLRHCPASEQLLADCRATNEAYEATIKEVRSMDAEMACTDNVETDCRNWARAGECEKNPAFMHLSCRFSCNLCTRPETRYSASTSGLASELERVAPSVPGKRPPAPHGPPPPPATATTGYVVDLGQTEEEGAEDAAVAPRNPAASEGALSVPSGGRPLSYVSMRKREKRRMEHRCYTWTALSMQQVKDCVRAARGGLEWRLADGVRSTGHSSAASPPGGGAAKASGEHSNGGRGAGKGRRRSDEVQAAPGLDSRGAWRERANLGGALVAWMGVVGMFLSLLPVLYRRSKRSKLSPDRGPKVTSV